MSGSDQIRRRLKSIGKARGDKSNRQWHSFYSCISKGEMLFFVSGRQAATNLQRNGNSVYCPYSQKSVKLQAWCPMYCSAVHSRVFAPLVSLVENGSKTWWRSSRSASLRSPSLSSLLGNISLLYLKSHSDNNMSGLAVRISAVLIQLVLCVHLMSRFWRLVAPGLGPLPVAPGGPGITEARGGHSDAGPLR